MSYTTNKTILFILLLSTYSRALFEKIGDESNTLSIAKARTNQITLRNTTNNEIAVTVALDSHHTILYTLSAQKHQVITSEPYTYIQSITMPRAYYSLVSQENPRSSMLLIEIHHKTQHALFNQIVSATDFEFDIGKHPEALRRAQKDYILSVAETNLFSKLVMPGFYPEHLLSYFIDLYTHNNLTKQKPDITPRIPKIIHHVWLGCPFPDSYNRWRQSWIDKHPEWVDILWVDNPENYSHGTLVSSYPELQTILANQTSGVYVVPCELVFPLFHQDFFEKTANLGERSDIFRVDVLNRFGGLYVDTDFECIEPFDILNHTYDFYAGLAPVSMNKIQVANGLIASRPHHPILKAYQAEITDSSQLYYLGTITGLFSGTPIVAATGPAPLTRAIALAQPHQSDRNIIFPPSVFYAHRLTMREYAKNNPFPPKHFEDFPDTFALPIDACAIHYWESSWNK